MASYFLLGGVIGCYLASLAWVYRDARKHGHPARMAVLFVMVAVWPLSLCVWLLIRSNMSLGYKDGGTAWG
jgi:hypothetical protein